MTHPLDGVRAKLRRAHEHKRAFDEVFGAFLEEDPYSLTVKFDPDTGWHEVRWRVWSDPPAEHLTMIFGDFLANLRAALDHLVHQLVIVNGCVPTDRNAFPVVKESKDWPATRGGILKGVSDTWAERIERLQPCCGGHPLESNLLAILDEVNNANKHRVLPIAVFSPERLDARINVEPLAVGDTIEFDPGFAPVVALGPIEHGALAMRFRWAGRHEQLDMDMNEAPTFRVAFGGGPNWTNDSMFEFVRATVALFEPAFDS